MLLKQMRDTVTISVAGPFWKVGERFEYLKRMFEFVPEGLVVRPKLHLEKLYALAKRSRRRHLVEMIWQMKIPLRSWQMSGRYTQTYAEDAES